MEVPVQYFQSVITVELAVAGALLWQLRYFDTSSAASREGERVAHPRLRLLLAAVVGGTLFGSLWAIANNRGSWAASAITVGLAVSLLPIMLRVLPPLAKDAATHERDAEYGVTVVAVALYTAAVAAVVVLLNV